MSVEPVRLPAGPFTFSGLACGPADGRLVMLLHGFPQGARQWRHQLAAFGRAGYRAIAFDQRGYSPEARPEGVEHYAIDHLVADVVSVADELGGHRVDLVGHDWGAAVAWHLASRHPERVRTLAAVSVPHPAALVATLKEGSLDQAKRSAYIVLFRQEHVAEKTLLAAGATGLRKLFDVSGFPSSEASEIDGYVQRLSEPGALTAALNWYRAVSLDDDSTFSPVEGVPTLFVWGDGDPAIGREAAERCASFVEGPFRFEELAGVGHWVPEEAPEVLNRLLLEHLEAGDREPEVRD